MYAVNVVLAVSPQQLIVVLTDGDPETPPDTHTLGASFCVDFVVFLVINLHHI